jgi:hypothetical protein
MTCRVMCDTLRNDADDGDECVVCGREFVDVRGKAPGSFSVPANVPNSNVSGSEPSRGPYPGNPPGSSTLLGPPRTNSTLPPSRGVIVRTIRMPGQERLRRGAAYHLAAGKTLARYLRPLYARRAARDRAQEE